MPDDRSWRADVTRRTAVPALALGRLPQWVPLAVVTLLMIGGLLAGGLLGAVLLTLVAAAAGWLAALRWDALAPAGRVVRLLVIGLLLVGAGAKLLAG